jgi:hypothetical protein
MSPPIDKMEARALAEWFGVKLGAGRIAAVLRHTRHPTYIPTHRLSEQANISMSAVGVYLCALRKAMPEDAIEHNWRSGYRLSAAGRTDCDQAILDLQSRVAALWIAIPATMIHKPEQTA